MFWLWSVSLFLLELHEFDSSESVDHGILENINFKCLTGAGKHMEDILGGLVRELLEEVVLTGCFTAICVLQQVLGNDSVVLPVDDNALVAHFILAGIFVAPDVD